MRCPLHWSGSVLQDVEQTAALDVEDDVLETETSVLYESRVLRIVAREVFHSYERRTTCAHKTQIGIGAGVPTTVPKRGPRTIIRQPTPTKKAIKTGPETVDFRPVL